MLFSAKPFQPPLKAPHSNGSLLYHYIPLTALTPSPICSLLISLAAVHIKPQPSLSLASDRNKMRRLQTFIDHFCKAAFRTPHLNQEMILQCMALTLKPGPFANNVYLHPPTSMHELKLHAADYIRMEEMQTLHTKFCNDYTSSTATPPNHPHGLILDPKNLDNLASPDMHP